ncbi:MAG: Molybdenum transport ATP-binding protein ModC [uncultured Pyrinomonadaceae bacterium]|uniref:Molybdenum transport ATP-binding protein ModC n=1 Tax=uncultured Pyrinomonadaceae bacterium TaxID=2283094 RepID=A0A6J4NKP9_9BACT|nr:MAG: Molybdenum transport ATP-binding protein ModC [uncultured Pyrinomonadaceae bacterium]
MSESFLQLKNVRKKYGERNVVDDVSFDVAAGETIALLGASGSGKTTILRLVAGLEKSDTGEIWLAGQCVSAGQHNLVPPHKRKIGFVFQDLALWSHLTVMGNLGFVLRAVGVGRQERHLRAMEMLRLMRIEQFAESFPNRLSGGEQQRVALARALVTRPHLLLFDEPLSSLDPELKSALLVELKKWLKKLEITTVYVTHDHAEAHFLAGRIVKLRNGKVTNEFGE